jgi:hypothetical protein
MSAYFPSSVEGAGTVDQRSRQSRLASSESRRSWRIIPDIDKDERMIAFVQQPVGRAVLFIVSVLLTRWIGGSPLVAALACACAYAGRYRWPLISLGTLATLLQNGFWVDFGLVARIAKQEGVSQDLDVSILDLHLSALHFGMPAFVALLCCLLIRVWPKTSAHISTGRTTLFMTLFFVGLVFLAQSPICTGTPRVLLWSFLLTFLPYFWFLGYVLTGNRTSPAGPIWQRMGLLHPFWCLSLTPIGKTISYLQKYESRTSADLAVTQLKGVKLLSWAVIVSIALKIFAFLVYDRIRIPIYDDLFSDISSGHYHTRLICWISLISSFFNDLMELTIGGGAIIAFARLSGFRLLRNTYSPLSAKSIADFWNRYYFFYKELLVDFFFYPTFLSFFRNQRKLRLFFATFMSACVGNLLYHFLRDIHFIADLGFAKALIGEESHALYTFLLAVGIFTSQNCTRNIRPSLSWLNNRTFTFLRIVLFFCVLHVFDAPLDREHSLLQHFSFLLYLFGIGSWT